MITVRTVPKADATGVQIGALPLIVFTEPVKNVPVGVTLTEKGGPTIGVLLSGVGPNGPIAVLTPQSIVTSLTIQPSAGLKYGTKYTLTLSSDIVDTDVAPNPNKPLVPYTTSFTTFAPESIGQTEELFTAGGMAVIGDRAYIATPQHVGRFFTNLRLFDVSDPTSPLEITSNEATSSQIFKAPPAFWLGLPVDVVADEQSPLTGGPVVAVATTPLTYPYHASNVRLYDVSNEQQWRWIGAVSLGRDPSDGMIRRIEIKDSMLYAVTAGIGKGIQFVDLNAVQGTFDEVLAGGEQSAAYWQMQGKLNSTEGFAQEAIVNTVHVNTGTGANSQLWDLAVTDLAINGSTQTSVVATGRSPLVIASQTDGLIYNGDITDGLGGPALTSWGYGIAAGTVAGTPIAVVSAIGVAGAPVSGPHVLAIVDLTNPAAPRMLSMLPLPGSAGATQDIVLRDTSVFIGTNAGTYLVSVADPNAPRFVGTIAGVQGRLGSSSDAILIGTRRGLTETTSAEGGVRAAALAGPLVLIPRIPPQLTRTVEGANANQLEELIDRMSVPVILLGAQAQVAGAALEQDTSTLFASGLTFNGSSASTTVPSGIRFSTSRGLVMRATVQTTDGVTLTARRVIASGRVRLVLDATNDRVLNEADIAAMAQGRTWAFWEADRKNLSSFDPAIKATAADVEKPTTAGLADLATIELHVEVPLDNLEIRATTEFPSAPQIEWSLSPKRGEGVAYLTETQITEAQRDLVAAECNTRGAEFLGRCDGQGSRVQLRNVQPGTYRYLFRCEKCPVDGSRRLELSYTNGDGQSVTLHNPRIDIRPIKDWMPLLTARRDQDKVSGSLEPVPGWAPLSNRPGTVTVLVHGYGVSHDAAAESYGQLFRNLYWSGLPVLFDRDGNPDIQENATQVVGITWPRNVGQTGLTYFPGDEFAAFQVGVPLGRFFEERKASSQNLHIVAHSLGNLAVNSALLRAPSMRPANDRYIMVDASVAAESFAEAYDPQNDPAFADPAMPWNQMVLGPAGAAAAGFPTPVQLSADQERQNFWNDNRSVCESFVDGQICTPVQTLWANLAAQFHPDLDPKPTYTRRWQTATVPFSFSPWRGMFAGSTARAAIVNVFNANDQALEISGRFNEISPWRFTQLFQKPYVGINGTAPDNGGLSWALTDYVRKDSDFVALWSAQPEDDRQRANLMRKWAELSFQIQPVSGPAGAQPIAAAPIENKDFSAVGGNGGGLSYDSHTYWTRPLSATQPFFDFLVMKLK